MTVFSSEHSNPQLMQIVDLIKRDNLVLSCIRRIRNYCLVDGFRLRENSKELSHDFIREITPHFMLFLENTIELYYFCGFVPYVVRKTKSGVVVPVTLPIGTFTWSIEADEGKSTNILTYKVKILLGNVKEEEVEIAVLSTPYAPSQNVLETPIKSLVFHKEAMRFQEKVALDIQSYNRQKHVVLSESVELKDQTSSGIMLLDEFRRYTMSGYHPDVDQSVKFKLKGAPMNNMIHNINDASFAWVNHLYQDDQTVDAKVVPPNMNVVELQNIPQDNSMAIERENYVHAVYRFFDLPEPDNNGGRALNAEVSLLSREQYVNIRVICDKLETVIESAYNKCYPNIKSVDCMIDPQSRLSINSAQDVKLLVDSNVMGPLDQKLVRQMFLPHSKRRKPN